MQDSRRYIFIDYLKAFGVLLVMNSHFDKLYPISALATGGAMGNGLFFIVSGFCLWPVKEEFRGWMTKRIVRLYLPTTLVSALLLFTTKRELISLSNMIPIFIWPTLFWFVGGILVLYLLYYLLRHIVEDRQFVLCFIGACIVYIVYYYYLDTSVWVVESTWVIQNGVKNLVAGSFKLVYCFVLMMLGKFLRIHADEIKLSLKVCLINMAGGVSHFTQLSSRWTRAWFICSFNF